MSHPFRNVPLCILSRKRTRNCSSRTVLHISHCSDKAISNMETKENIYQRERNEKDMAPIILYIIMDRVSK